VANELGQTGRGELSSGFVSKGVSACASAALDLDHKHDLLI
jgi:hypothetical protein